MFPTRTSNIRPSTTFIARDRNRNHNSHNHNNCKINISNTSNNTSINNNNITYQQQQSALTKTKLKNTIHQKQRQQLKKNTKVGFQSTNRLQFQSQFANHHQQNIQSHQNIHKTQKQILQQWVQKATKVNQKIKMKRLLTPNRQPYQFLSRCNGTNFQEDSYQYQQQNNYKQMQKQPFNFNSITRNTINNNNKNNFRIAVDSKSKNKNVYNNNNLQLNLSIGNERNSQSYKLLPSNSLHSKKQTQNNQSKYIKNALQAAQNLSQFKVNTNKQLNKLSQSFRENNASSNGFSLTGLKSPKDVQLTKNVFYEAMINRIGYNMQYQSKFRIQHLLKIKAIKGSFSTPSSIIFCIKDTPFKPNQIGQRVQSFQPICLSLYPEFFDSDNQNTKLKRQEYIDKLHMKMNGTYDPYLLSKIPMISNYPQFNPVKYFQLLPNYIKFIQQDYKKQWAQNIIQNIKFPLKQKQIKCVLKQIWDLFNQGNGMAIFDYILKDPKQMKRLNVVPFLKTRYTTSDRILYHGGYSKIHFQPWSQNVANMKAKLQKKITKLNLTTQKVNRWNTIFDQLSYIDLDFLFQIGKPLSINFFSQTQLQRIQQTFNIMKNIWFRGLFLILQKKKFLMRFDQCQYLFLNDNQGKIKKLIREAKSKVLQNNFETDLQQQNFYLKFYKNWLKSLHRPSNIYSLKQLKQIDVEDGQKPSRSNLLVMLKIQFSQSIRRSFFSLKNYILNPLQMTHQNKQYKPIIKLNLIVDRQTLKFKQNKETIVQIFKQIIKKLFSLKLKGSQLSYQFNRNDLIQKIQEGQAVQQYPQIIIIQNDKPTSIHLDFGNLLIHNQQITQIIHQIKIYYDESLQIIQFFQPFFPFIKLLAHKQFCIEDNSKTSQDLFLQDMKRIKEWKDKLNQTKAVYITKFFYVNCSEAIKSIHEKISQIQYRIDQKYQKQIYDKMYQIEQKINDIKNQIFSKIPKPQNIQSLSHQLQICLKTVKKLTQAVKEVAKKVYFFVNNQRRSGPIVNRFQLIAKNTKNLKQEIQYRIKQMDVTRPLLQNQLKEQGKKIRKKISILISQINQTQAQFIDITYNDSYFVKVEYLGQKLQKVQDQIKCYSSNLQSMNMIDILKQQFDDFNEKTNKFQSLMQFWSGINKFHLFFKQINRMRVRDISFEAYDNLILESLRILNNFKQHKKANPIQQRYWKIFQVDIAKYNTFSIYVKILSNNKIKERHWQPWKNYINAQRKNIQQKQILKKNQAVSTQKLIQEKQQLLSICTQKIHLKDIIFKQITLLKFQKDENEILLQMSKSANLEYDIQTVYERILKSVKTMEIKIIDINGADALDIQDSTKIKQMLYSYYIQCTKLLQNEYCKYYQNDLKKLKEVIYKGMKAVQKWLEFESDYINFSNYYITNEEAVNQQLFLKIKEIHRKIIKSFDFDNTLWFLAQNIVLQSCSQQIIQQILVLKIKTIHYLQNVQKQYPRLYLLSHEQLFEMMWDKDNVQYYILKCFNHISKVYIKEGCIEKIGSQNQLKLSQEIYFIDRLGNVDGWLKNLEQGIKKSMKQVFFKYILDNQFYNVEIPLQLEILAQQIQYTKEIEDKINANGIDIIISSNLKKINENHKKINHNSQLMLLHIVYRQILNNLKRQNIKNINQFQWQRYPRFYSSITFSTQSSININKVNIQIMKQQYSYNFNYLDKCQMMFTDHVLLGNCFIGNQQTGKRSLLNYYSYLTGNQLIIFDSIKLKIFNKNITEHLIKYVKLASFSGSWMCLHHLQQLSFSQLSVYAQCLLSIQQSLQSQKTQITIFGQSIKFHGNSRFFMTSSNLKNNKIPQRLLSIMRPNFVIKPDSQFLTQLYFESHGIKDKKIYKTIEFSNWIDYQKQLPLKLTQLVKNADSALYFIKQDFYQDLMRKGYFKEKGISLIKECKQENQINNLDNLFRLNNKDHKVIYGPSCSGKTTTILNYINKFAYCHIDLSVFSTQNLSHFLKYANEIQPQYILIQNGIDYFYVFQDLIKKNPKIKLIFEQRNLCSIYGPFLHELITIYYENKRLGLQICEQQNYQIYEKNFKSIHNSLLERLDIDQQNLNYCNVFFFKFYKKMIEKQFKPSVAFTYSFIWVYSQFIMDNMVNSCIQLFDSLKCLKDIYDISQFQNLIPLTNQFSHEINDHQFQINIWQNQAPIIIKNNILYNMMFLRSLIIDPIHIESRDWLTTILKTSINNSLSTSKYFSVRDNSSIFSIKQKIIENSTQVPYGKKNVFQSNSHVIIDDIHLGPKNIQTSIQYFAQNNQILYYNSKSNQVDYFGVQGIIFTLGSHVNYNQRKNHFLSGSLVRKQKYLVTKNQTSQKIMSKIIKFTIHEKSQELIFRFYVTNLWNQYPNVQFSYQFFLFAKIIQTKYDFFWLKTPLFKCHNPIKKRDFKSYCSKVLLTFIDMLPIKYKKSINQSLQRSHKNIDEMVKENLRRPQELQVLNSFDQSKQFDNIINDLIQQNAEKMMITDYQENCHIFVNDFVKVYTLKILRSLINHHLVLMGQMFTLRQAILKFACEILGFPMLIYHEKIWQDIGNMNISDTNMKVVVMIKNLNLNNFQEGNKLMNNIQDIIKFRKIPEDLGLKVFNKENILNKVIFVIKMNPKNPITKKYYEKYSMLKSRFLTIYFEKQQNLNDFIQTEKFILEKQDAMKKAQKYQQVFEELNDEKCFKIIENLLSKQNLDRDFLLNFSAQFNRIKMEQISKFQFYRTIVQNMVINIDKLTEQQENLPQQIKIIKKNLNNYQMQKDQIKLAINQSELKQYKVNQFIKNLQIKIKQLRDQQNYLQQKIQSINTFINNKFIKIENKIQKITSSQFNKFKKITTQPQKALLELIVYVTQDISLHPSHLQIIRKKDFNLEIFNSPLNENLKNKCQIFKILGHKRFQKLNNCGKIIYDWFSFFDQSYLKIKQLKKLQKQLNLKLNQIKQTQEKEDYQNNNLNSFKQQINQLNNQYQRVSEKQSCENNIRKQLILWEQRLGSVLLQVKNLNYIKIMSSHHSAFFRSLYCLIFKKAITYLRFNEFIDDQQVKSACQYDSNNLFNDYEYLQNFRDKFNLKISSYEHLSYVYNIINCHKKIVVLQDRNNMILQSLHDVCIENNYTVINQPLIPIQNLQNLIFSRMKNYKKVLVIYNGINGVNGGWNTLNTLIQKSIITTNSFNDNQSNRKIIIVLKQLTKLELESFQEVLQGKIIPDNNKFEKDLIKIVAGNQYVQQGHNLQNTIQYNNSLKLLSKHIDELSKQSLDHNQGASFQTYEKIQNNMQKIRQLIINAESSQAEILTIKNARRKLKNKLYKFKITYKYLQYLQLNSQVNLFEQSEYYNCFMQILKSTKIQNSKNVGNIIEIHPVKKQSQKDINFQNKDFSWINQDVLQKLLKLFITNLGKKIQWNSQSQLKNYCLFALLITQCPNEQHILTSLLSLINKNCKEALSVQQLCRVVQHQMSIIGIQSKQVYQLINDSDNQNNTKKLKGISKNKALQSKSSSHFDSFKFQQNKTAISNKTFLDPESSNSLKFSKLYEKQKNFNIIPVWVQYIIHFLFSKSSKKKKVIDIAVNQSKNDFLREILQFKHYYQQIKDLQFNKSEKILTLIQSPWNKISEILNQIKIKANMKGKQFQTFYFNRNNFEQSIQKLINLAQKKQKSSWVYIPNLGRQKIEDDTKIIQRILYQIGKGMNYYHKLRIFIVIDYRISIRHKYNIYKIKRKEELDFNQFSQILIKKMENEKKDCALMVKQLFLKKGNKIIGTQMYPYLFEQLSKYLQKDKFQKKIGSIAYNIQGQDIRKIRQKTALKIISHYFSPLKLTYNMIQQQLKRTKTILQKNLSFQNTLKKSSSYFENYQEIPYNSKQVKAKIKQSMNQYYQPYFISVIEQFNKIRYYSINDLKKISLYQNSVLMNIYSIIEQLAKKNICVQGIQIQNWQIFNSIIYSAVYQLTKCKQITQQGYYLCLAIEQNTKGFGGKQRKQIQLGQELYQYMKGQNKYDQTFRIILKKNNKNSQQLVNRNNIKTLFQRFRVFLLPSKEEICELGKIQINFR